jgi:PTS system cellobiose-specific IIC component
MSEFTDNIIGSFSAIANKIGSQRHLGAVRDGFVSLLPLMIVGSLVTLINNLPIGDGRALRDVLSSIPVLSWIVSVNGNVWWGTFGMLAIFACFSISYNLAKSYEGNPLSAGLVSLATYFAAAPQATEALGGWGYLHISYVNAQGLFVAIIIALITTEIFVKFSKSPKLIINMPAGVPPAVSRSFAALIPSILTVIIVSAAVVLFTLFVGNNLFDFISQTLVRPLGEGSGTLAFGFVIVFLTHLFWVFGIHGPNIFEGLLQPLNLLALDNNQALFNAGATEGYTIFSKAFLDAYVYMGGSGVGLGLVISLLLLSKAKSHRMIGKLGAAPAVFNINEPLLFGVPIVLNPTLAVPFILSPLVLLVIAYNATAAGIVPPVMVLIPWTTPPVISGFLVSNSITGPILQIINLAISVLIYMPFVKIADNAEKKKEMEAEAA